MQIPQRIEQRRVAAGLSETRLAIESAIPRTTLTRRMLDPAGFTLGELERIARVLGVKVSWLVGYEDAA